MTSRDFCYWLQGFFEIAEADIGKPITLSDAGIDCIRRHLAMVFKHEIDPSFGDAKHQAELVQAHAGGATGQDPKQILGELLGSRIRKC
jgi:hypothetical protein